LSGGTDTGIGMIMTATIDTKLHQRLVQILIEARRKRGLGQRDTAKKLGHSQTWISRIEKGERRVDVREYVQLCRLFRIDPLKLLRKLID